MNIHDLSRVERESILAFVESCAPLLTGRVLDFGCGQSPYRDIIEAAGGEYLPFDRVAFGGNVSRADVGAWDRDCDAVVCTQVIQYVSDPAALLEQLRFSIAPGGVLVLTYPTNWPELRDELWRFTMLGMDMLLTKAGFVVERHERRGLISGDLHLAIGYGAVARA